MRESSTRRHKGKPDVCFTIDYKDANGKRVRKDVGWASEGFSAALASEMRSKLIHEAKEKSALGPSYTPPQTMLTLLQAWEIYKKDWMEAKGKKWAYDQSLIDTYLKPIATRQLAQITPHDLDLIMGEMRQKGCAAQTIRLAIGLVSRIMRKLAVWRLYNGSLPFDAITLPKLNNSRARFLTPEEARRLLDEIKRRSLEMWLMALISLHCGLRFGEIARLCWSDVNFSEKTLHIREAKSGYGRFAVATDDVLSALRVLPRKTNSGLIFPSKEGKIRQAASDSFSRAVDKLGLNAGITDRRQKVVFHTLRHTYASWLAKSGQGQLTIADRLGHRSLQMTARYTHLMDETRRETANAITRFFHDQENQS